VVVLLEVPLEVPVVAVVVQLSSRPPGKKTKASIFLLRKKKLCLVRMLLRFLLVSGGPYGKTILIALQKGPTHWP
jgi:hypothetical protein